ncbi:hypothetical protein M404DRAFT_31118 [Pisolithus tinctorius Marx 270]|uniref:Uncharacterized protein n=1 Tax=Pisolithus tinctorius Marx 270 TaxID=870435 RepID=A0A0C3IPB2_PISTI|nr:hypothetical protein M404DRAFT_31118 [Pisolithus tinctorius Marx 270]
MSPLTPQPSKLENSWVMQNPNNPQDIENPLSQVYIEGEMPSMRELNEEVPLDPWVALAAMNEFLENIQQQWRDYGYGPESFHNHGIDPGKHHTNMIECIRRVLAIENLEEQTSRASSPDTRTATKREELEVDLQMMEDPPMVMEVVTGRIGTPHEGVKNTDVPIWDKGMDCQGTVPPKDRIIGEVHREVVSPEEIQASLEGISPPMMKMTMIIMIVEGIHPRKYKPTGQLGPEVKAMGVPKPGKYKGQDDLEEFDNWLGQLLKYFFDIQEDTEHEHACIENKVEEVPDNPDDDEEVQVYEGTTEVTPKNTESAEPDKFINTLKMYSEVDEEDEPVVYFGAMDTEDKPLEEEVVYCVSIHAEVQERQMPSEDDAPMQEDDPLIQEDSPGNDAL